MNIWVTHLSVVAMIIIEPVSVLIGKDVLLCFRKAHARSKFTLTLKKHDQFSFTSQNPLFNNADWTCQWNRVCPLHTCLRIYSLATGLLVGHICSPSMHRNPACTEGGGGGSCVWWFWPKNRINRCAFADVVRLKWEGISCVKSIYSLTSATGFFLCSNCSVHFLWWVFFSSKHSNKTFSRQDVV